MVSQFHQLFDAPILDTPQIPPIDRANLRVSLLQEELDEFIEAIKNNNLIEAADALADMQYVLTGTVLEFGLWDKFADIFAEVQRSNMSKACISIEEAEKTVDFYRNQKNIDTYMIQKWDQYLIYRSSDNKSLKSINYSSVDLKKII